MNWIDIIICGGIAYLMFRGFRTGLIQTIFRFLSIFAGFAIAISYKELLSGHLDKLGLNLPEFWQKTVSFIILFLITVGVIQLIGITITKMLKPTPLGPLDRIGGALIGAFKGILACILLTFLLSLWPQSLAKDSFLAESMILRECKVFLPWLGQLFSENQHKIFPKKPFSGKDSLKNLINSDGLL